MNAPTVDELAEVVVALAQRVEELEVAVYGEEERPGTLAEARAALLARAKERRAKR